MWAILALALLLASACLLRNDPDTPAVEVAMSLTFVVASSAVRSAACRPSRTQALSPAAFMARARGDGVVPLARAYSSAPSRASPLFTYRLAAAAAAKRTPPRPPKYGQDFWRYSSADENRIPPYIRSTTKDSGEDAFFMTTVGGDRRHVAMGVADGVGGWQDQGVDPSDFTHALCGLMAGTAYIHEGLGRGKVPKPRALLQTAYDAVMANPRIVAGGCTASLAVLQANGSMEAANLGDSGFLILSPGKVTHRSRMQTHAFNTPYQLSKIPARMQVQHAIFGGSMHLSETPAQADVSRHQLRHGDVVVFATDGVWDNLSAQETLAVVVRVMEEQGVWVRRRDWGSAETALDVRLGSAMAEGGPREGDLPALLATAVMREAKLAGLDRWRDGPFAKEVKRLYPQEGWEGGKADDIAVVVACAVEEAGEAGEKAIMAKV